jgi:hypothetical protein
MAGSKPDRSINIENASLILVVYGGGSWHNLYLITMDRNYGSILIRG